MPPGVPGTDDAVKSEVKPIVDLLEHKVKLEPLDEGDPHVEVVIKDEVNPADFLEQKFKSETLIEQDLGMINGLPFGVTGNAIYTHTFPKHNFECNTLVDESLQVIDPYPVIWTLCEQFDQRFFNNELKNVKLSFSDAMTCTASKITYRHIGGKAQCSIKFNRRLFSMRPRKDVVHFLLKEMIHAYIFVTRDTEEGDVDHDSQYLEHVRRIDKLAGTSIPLSRDHGFDTEVQKFLTHWWKCDGPCQKMVKRSTNSRPRACNWWWKDHVRTCGGEFTKIREPKKTGKAKKRARRANSL